MALSAKQQQFITHYLDCLNATEAARRAGYADPGQQGHRLLKNVEIAAEIKAGLAEKAMTADEVLARLSAIARADVRALLEFGDDGQITGLRLHQDAPLFLVKKIVPTVAGTRIELHDPVAALTTLARAHGLLNTFDWSKVPQQIVDAIADGRLTVDDLKRLAAPGTE